MPKSRTALFVVVGCTGALVLGLGFLTLIVLVSKYGQELHPDANPNSAQVIAPAVEPTEVRGTQRIYQIGEPVNIGGRVYTVHGVRWTDVLEAFVPEPNWDGPPVRSTLDLGDTVSMWALVDISIRNTGSKEYSPLTKPLMVMPGGLSHRCEESVMGEGIAEYAMRIPGGGVLRTLIPYKVLPRSPWRLAIDGGFDDPARALIDLKGFEVPVQEPRIRFERL